MVNYWHYSKKIGDGGLNRKPPRLKDLGEHSVRIFVREVIQNNLDASEEGKPIIVEINIKEWGKSEIDTFFDFVGNEHIELLKKSATKPDPSVFPYLKDCIDIINGRKTSTFLITVEETNCIGLLGPVRETESEKSHFDALMRKIENNEAKKETTNTGGTWGKGSSIFTYTSLLWTWFSYSKLSKPWIDPETNIIHEKRFIGRCMLAPFFDRLVNESYLGDGWFCDAEKLETAKIDAYPFINEEADLFAAKLGLPIRDDKSGTTFFIPFFKPQIENGNEIINLEILTKEFIEQILQNWYIPIYNGLLTVIVKSETQKIQIDKGYLKSVNELKYKLELLEWYANDCPPSTKIFLKEKIEIEVPALKVDYLDSRTKFAKSRRKVSTDLIIRILDEDEDFIDNWGTVNKIALCRNKGMIINNESLFETKAIRTESILLGGLMSKFNSDIAAKRHFDLFLAFSENPAHNTWCRSASDYDRCFLDRFEGRRPKPEASINHLFNEILGVYKKLLEEDIEHKENKDICSIFKKLTKLKSSGADSVGKSLFYMRSISDDIDIEGKYIYIKKLISASNTNHIEIYFKSYVDSLEGEKDRDFELLGIADFSNLDILNNNDAIIESGNNPKIKLSPNEELIVKIRTCIIDKNPYFKNVEPFVKVYAKLIENE